MTPLFSESVLEQRIQELGKHISLEKKDSDLILIGVLNGSFIFLADLCRAIHIPHEIDFIGASSYGSAIESSGKLEFTKTLQTDIYQKSVIVVEDIVDTGFTLQVLLEYLLEKKPLSLEIASLFWKKHKSPHIHVKYAGFEVADEFLVGFGLDFAGKYRHLPFVGRYSLTSQIETNQ